MAEGHKGYEGEPLKGLRVGQGFDAHRFAGSGSRRELWLAGIRWTEDEARGVAGLAGDSDGDVAAHALIDAMLSAGDAGDIGGLFGVGASGSGVGMHGVDMIRRTAELLRSQGWSFVNGTIAIIGNDPHVNVYRSQAEQAMSEAAGFPISITATTTDHMGFTGRGEGVAAFSTVLAVRSGA